MKRILLTVHKFFPDHRAGTEVLTLKVAQELRQRGYQVSILTADPPDSAAQKKKFENTDNEELSNYEYEGVSVYCLSEKARLRHNRFSHEHYNPYLKECYRTLLDLLAPDLVHCFHLQNISTSLIEEASARNIPVIYSATDFWLICPVVQLRRPDGSNCCGPAALAVNCLTCYTPRLFPDKKEFVEALSNKYQQVGNVLARLPKPLNITATAGLYFTYLSTKLPNAIKATSERPALLKHFADKLAAITVPTKLMQELFVRNGLDAKHIHHIPYGIDTVPLKQGQDKIPSDKLRIAFIGTIAEHKGPDLLIKAFLQLPTTSKISLKIYGDLSQFPEYSDSLRKLIQTNSPLADNIIFAGTFPNDQIGVIFKEIDVLVVPSRWYENTPLVIQSAFAAKTPIIATDLGGMSELIKHEVNGMLFEPDSPKSLNDQLLKLLENKSLLLQLINNIQPERTIANMVNQLECLYADLLLNDSS